ncbi:MAG TPA: hypothetical protein VJY39_00815 [Acidisphaera sp.]|nr:hypothetical protein [Acidisphaera sp.]
MPHEVRIDGRPAARFDTQAKAVAHASVHADENSEVVDAETGEPAARGATAEDRGDLARKVGF